VLPSKTVVEQESKRLAVLGIGRSVVLGVAGVAVAAVLSAGLVRAFQIKHQEQRITVTGSATRRIRSDLVVWRATVRAQNAELTEAYKKLASDVPQLLAFIQAHGMTEQQITVSAASITEVHPRTQEGVPQEALIAAYVAQQEVTVESTDIQKVEQISREATQLLDRGVYVQSSSPLYIYTKLAPLKIQMLAEASKDARLRAEQIAVNTRSTLGKLITGRMGVMQVNEKFATEVSAEGNNDKTTLEKDVLAVVTAVFDVR
jgi:uncharacterized protein